jgi:hypothetical protein
MILEIPDKDVEVITLGLKCKKCGHMWRLRLDRFNGEKVPLSRFICEACLEKESKDEKQVGDRN